MLLAQFWGFNFGLFAGGIEMAGKLSFIFQIYPCGVLVWLAMELADLKACLTR